MKKNIAYITLATLIAAFAITGCSKTTDVTPTPAPAQTEAATLELYDSYKLIEGHEFYYGTNNAYSILLPIGSQVNDADPNDVKITIANESGGSDIINIKYKSNEQVIETESQLMEKLKSDDSIDITGFFVLKIGGAYEGYKYTCTAMSDPNFKSIKSVYFANDGSVYEVTASSPNGNDDLIMTNLNTIVDTFVNNG